MHATENDLFYFVIFKAVDYNIRCVCVCYGIGNKQAGEQKEMVERYSIEIAAKKRAIKLAKMGLTCHAELPVGLGT